MARMFKGSYDLKVDPKGRVSIPAPFRRIIEAADPDFDPKDKTSKDRAVFSVGYGLAGKGFLEGFSVESLAGVHADMEALKRGSPARKTLEYLYLANVQDMQIDDNGRIVLPAAWREKMGLGEDAKFVGYGNRFEIWSPETYAHIRGAQTEAFLEAQGEDFDPQSLFEAEGGSA